MFGFFEFIQKKFKENDPWLMAMISWISVVGIFVLGHLIWHIGIFVVVVIYLLI